MHTVKAAGRPDYVGETLYYFDSASQQVAFLYVENGGGFSRGSMVATKDGLEFPETDYVAAGESSCAIACAGCLRQQMATRPTARCC
jgi:hypothetical protein